MPTKSIQTAVAGVSGYAGLELARLLLRHPALQGRPPVFVGRDEKTTRLTDMHPQLADNNGSSGLLVQPFSWELLEERGVELIFMATPHEQSRNWAPEALARGLRVVDLSAAWRLREDEHRAVYGFHDEDAAAVARVQTKSVYGLPELNRACIRKCATGGEPRLLCHFHHSGLEAFGRCRVGRYGSRHRVRFESPACRAREKRPPPPRTL